MKFSVKKEAPIPPPKTYHLELSEQEMEFVSRLVDHYTVTIANGPVSPDAALRFLNSTKQTDWSIVIDYNKLFVK